MHISANHVKYRQSLLLLSNAMVFLELFAINKMKVGHKAHQLHKDETIKIEGKILFVKSVLNYLRNPIGWKKHVIPFN